MYVKLNFYSQCDFESITSTCYSDGILIINLSTIICLFISTKVYLFKYTTKYIFESSEDFLIQLFIF